MSDKEKTRLVRFDGDDVCGPYGAYLAPGFWRLRYEGGALVRALGPHDSRKAAQEAERRSRAAPRRKLRRRRRALRRPG